MTTLVTADAHFSANPRDAYRFRFLEETLPALMAEHGAQRLLVLGDLTEQKDGHGPGLVNRIVDGFAALAESADVYLLKGNHDYLAEDVPFFRYMGHLPRTHWINDPEEMRLRGLGRCLFLPHTRDLGDWADWVLLAKKYDWYFCHQTFGGADLGHGHRADGAQDPRATFGKNARVVSGDVHVPQELGPVTYIGSPYTIDFGDDFEPRVLVLDREEMRSVPVPGPQKRLVTIRSRTDAYPNVGPGDIVKLRIEVPAGNETSRAEWRAQAYRWAEAAGVQLYTVQVVTPTTRPGEKAAATRRQRTDEELVRAYAKKLGKGKTTVAAGMKIVEETL